MSLTKEYKNLLNTALKPNVHITAAIRVTTEQEALEDNAQPIADHVSVDNLEDIGNESDDESSIDFGDEKADDSVDEKADYGDDESDEYGEVEYDENDYEETDDDDNVEKGVENDDEKGGKIDEEPSTPEGQQQPTYDAEELDPIKENIEKSKMLVHTLIMLSHSIAGIQAINVPLRVDPDTEMSMDILKQLMQMHISSLIQLVNIRIDLLNIQKEFLNRTSADE